VLALQVAPLPYAEWRRASRRERYLFAPSPLDGWPSSGHCYRVSNATSPAAFPVNPCAWDITVGWDDGVAVNVSVRRFDGLPFEHDLHAIAGHVRASLAAEGIDAGQQFPAFIEGDTVCVVRD
jgi:hypothetical protein